MAHLCSVLKYCLTRAKLTSLKPITGYEGPEGGGASRGQGKFGELLCCQHAQRAMYGIHWCYNDDYARDTGYGHFFKHNDGFRAVPIVVVVAAVYHLGLGGACMLPRADGTLRCGRGGKFVCKQRGFCVYACTLWLMSAFCSCIRVHGGLYCLYPWQDCVLPLALPYGLWVEGRARLWCNVFSVGMLRGHATDLLLFLSLCSFDVDVVFTQLSIVGSAVLRVVGVLAKNGFVANACLCCPGSSPGCMLKGDEFAGLLRKHVAGVSACRRCLYGSVVIMCSHQQRATCSQRHKTHSCMRGWLFCWKASIEISSRLVAVTVIPSEWS